MYGQGITRGKVGILAIPATINQACAAISTRTESIQTDYLFHYLASAYERLRSMSHGTQQLNLNAQLIRVHSKIVRHVQAVRFRWCAERGGTMIGMMKRR